MQFSRKEAPVFTVLCRTSARRTDSVSQTGFRARSAAICCPVRAEPGLRWAGERFNSFSRYSWMTRFNTTPELDSSGFSSPWNVESANTSVGFPSAVLGKRVGLSCTLGLSFARGSMQVGTGRLETMSSPSYADSLSVATISFHNISGISFANIAIHPSEKDWVAVGTRAFQDPGFHLSDGQQNTARGFASVTSSLHSFLRRPLPTPKLDKPPGGVGCSV